MRVIPIFTFLASFLLIGRAAHANRWDSKGPHDHARSDRDLRLGA
ncbi:MAG TPA: hypothetical protein VN253_16610 [Kofleriaceae bacterium]|nr:hypothetical protein [Kofleriaceae bacterium]